MVLKVSSVVPDALAVPFSRCTFSLLALGSPWKPQKGLHFMKFISKCSVFRKRSSVLFKLDYAKGITRGSCQNAGLEWGLRFNVSDSQVAGLCATLWGSKLRKPGHRPEIVEGSLDFSVNFFFNYQPSPLRYKQVSCPDWGRKEGAFLTVVFQHEAVHSDKWYW